MKCQFCGGNLDLKDEVCPFCGRENYQSEKHVKLLKNVRKEYSQAKSTATKKSIRNIRIAKIGVIALQVILVLVMLNSIKNDSDFDTREKRNQQKRERTVSNNRSEISAALKSMEKNREYLALEYYVLNLQLRSDAEYNDYSRVFTSVINYSAIYSDILNIVTGYNHYGDKTVEDWCKDIAIYIANWKQYCDGEFWHDAPDSPMHAGEHGVFLADIKKDTQDIVQIYFGLTDEEASSMWSMEESEIAQLLSAKCVAKNSEVAKHD